MKKLLFSALALGAILLAFSLSGPAVSVAEEEADGKSLFVETHKCSLCHSVGAAEIESKTKSESMQGPDLSGYTSDYSLDKIAAYARKEAELDGKEHKKSFKGTDEELQTILDWLGSLEARE